MEIHFTPEQQAQISQVATKAGTVPERLVAIRLLKTFPNRGRPGHRSGTEELALTPLPYVAVYSVKAEPVEILHVDYGAQDWR